MGNLILLFQRLVLLPINVLNPILIFSDLLNRVAIEIDKVATHELGQWSKQITADKAAAETKDTELAELAKQLAEAKATQRITNKEEATKAFKVS